MELSPLGALRSLLDKTPEAVTGSERAQLSILTGIALGMAYLHGQKPKPVLHHDLKSDNVLVWPDAVACFVAYISSGHNGIYLSQRIAVPKRPGRAHTGMVTLRDTRASRRSRCPSNTVKEHN